MRSHFLVGVARGCGWQKVGAYINLVSYYGVGLPVAYVLAFVFHIKAEVYNLNCHNHCLFMYEINFSPSVFLMIRQGLWLGINAGAVVQLIALMAITWATNWETEASFLILVNFIVCVVGL